MSVESSPHNLGKRGSPKNLRGDLTTAVNMRSCSFLAALIPQTQMAKKLETELAKADEKPKRK